MTTDEILQRLEGVKREREGQWAAKCPAHGDRKPSLAIKSADGKTLLHCHVGCKLADVLAALQLTEQDLFPPKADAGPVGEPVTTTYPYRSETGEVVFEVVRTDTPGQAKQIKQRRPNGAGGWVWNLEGIAPVLYRLPEILAADVAKPVFLVEGEKCADRVTHLGLLATTSSRGATAWDKTAEHAQRVLAGRHVVLVPDNDEPGRKFARDILASLRGVVRSIRIVELPGLRDKGDVFDWALAGGTAEHLLALARAVPDMRKVRPELAGIDIAPMSQRLAGERAERLAEAAKLIPFGVAYLDDRLGGMLPHDLIALTARPGAGKTELAATIAELAARAGRRPLMFALEAEKREIERRMKYRAIARELWPTVTRMLQANRQVVPTLNYAGWCRGEFDELLGEQEGGVDRHLVHQLGDRLLTVYRGKEFSLEQTERVMVDMADEVDLFVVDHLHYLDVPDEKTENEAVTAIMQRLRDLALRLGRPVVLVVHLKKEDYARPSLVPRLGDLAGSGNITRIATAVVALSPAPSEGKTEWNLSPTYMHVLKDRKSGADGAIARVVYDKGAGAYRSFYDLGRIVRGKQGDEWERIGNLPYWAKNAGGQMEMR